MPSILVEINKDKVSEIAQKLRSKGLSNLDIFHILKTFGVDKSELEKILSENEKLIVNKLYELKQIVYSLERRVDVIERKVKRRHELLIKILEQLEGKS